MTYEKAMAEVVLFDDSDIITVSGCMTWSSENGYQCHDALQLTDEDLKPPLS